jgi:hypothetical protein
MSTILTENEPAKDEQPTAEELKEREALAGQIDKFCEKAEKQAKN